MRERKRTDINLVKYTITTMPHEILHMRIPNIFRRDISRNSISRGAARFTVYLYLRSVSLASLLPVDAVNKALMKLLTSQILLSFRIERTGGSRSNVSGREAEKRERERALVSEEGWVRLRSR